MRSPSTQVLSHLSDLASAHQSFSLTLALCYVLGQLASLHFYDGVQVRLRCPDDQLHYTPFSGSINISVLFFPPLHPSLACKTPCVGIFQGFCGGECYLHRSLDTPLTQVTPHANAVQLCVPVTLTNTVIEFLHKVSTFHNETVCMYKCHRFPVSMKFTSLSLWN